ncbi:anti-sigma regulatory factor (Ser/Thr protein kinase) [Streptomyces sp. TLI_235]|nr:ATP-binding protein [Streptomyces sp. TLI_235]PBC69730.1 anti-sigma regulatory factor (Ser/Thr protein kinase) [Streptomyces sp. TLI_235]
MSSRQAASAPNRRRTAGERSQGTDMTSTGPPGTDACDAQGRRISMFVFPEPHQVRPVRHAVKAILSHWEMAHLTEDAELLTTELLTNAIRHTDGEQPIRVTIALDQRWLSIGVRDRSTSAPRVHRAVSCEEGGRGLFLVESVARSWACRFHRDGTKTVSCRLSL